MSNQTAAARAKTPSASNTTTTQATQTKEGANNKSISNSNLELGVKPLKRQTFLQCAKCGHGWQPFKDATTGKMKIPQTCANPHCKRKLPARSEGKYSMEMEVKVY